MQPVAVKVVRFDIRGGDQRHAAGEQAVQQTGQQHGVGYVGHEKLVEAQHVGLLRPLGGDAGQWVRDSAKVTQIAMDPLHKTVKVNAQLAAFGQGVEKQVHQPGLAATHTAPQVQALERGRPSPAHAVKQRGVLPLA